jgi:hypothetical protein
MSDLSDHDGNNNNHYFLSLIVLCLRFEVHGGAAMDIMMETCIHMLHYYMLSIIYLSHYLNLIYHVWFEPGILNPDSLSELHLKSDGLAHWG